MRSRKPGAKRSIWRSIASVWSTVDPGGDVAVGVAGVLAGGRARGVELALLDDQHERSLGVLAAPDGGLAGGDLVERAADVNGRGVEAARIAPRDRPVERPVELEDAGAVAVTAEPAEVVGGKERCADRGELRRAGVEEHDTRGRKIGERANRTSGLDRSAQGAEVRGESLADGLRSSRGDGPSRRRARSTRRAFPPRRSAAARAAGSSARRSPRAGRAPVRRGSAPETRSWPEGGPGARSGRPGAGAAGCASGAEQIGEELVRLAQEGSEEPLVGAGVRAETARRLRQRTRQDHGGLVVERVRDGGGRMDPPEAVVGERQAPEPGRQDPHRMATGADVVREPGERERGGAHSAADLVATPRAPAPRPPLARARRRRRARSDPSRR